MALTTSVKNKANRILSKLNLRVDSLTEAHREQTRLRSLKQQGHFDRPVFPVPAAFREFDPSSLFESLGTYRDRFDTFERPAENGVGYTFDNDFFSSPDAEVLYAMIRRHHPETIVEVGSGNSTKVSRQAIRDGELESQIVSIDPAPRTEVEDLTDHVRRQRVEAGWDVSFFEELREDDILFIDSSHTVQTGNDVSFLYLCVLPRLAPGVIVHVHDIFLPFEYPEEWVLDERHGWNEQYLVHALLQNNSAFDVLWPGRFVQQQMDAFEEHFPHMRSSAQASSLWLRKGE